MLENNDHGVLEGTANDKNVLGRGSMAKDRPGAEEKAVSQIETTFKGKNEISKRQSKESKQDKQSRTKN